MAKQFENEYYNLRRKGYNGTYESFICEKSEKLEKWVTKDVSLLKAVCERSVNTCKEKIKNLRDVADNLERVHYGTTVGSLTGSVVGAAGGVTSIVGLILAPFTLGASLIVTGVGIGVAVTGGLTSGVSNITNMVSKSTDRKHIEKILKDYADTMEPIRKCLGDLSNNLETLQELRTIREKGQGDSFLTKEQMSVAGSYLSRSVGRVPELANLVRLGRAINAGRVAAQSAKALRVTEVFTGVLSALFLAVDVYFVVHDSMEIHNMRQSNAESPTQSQSDTVRFIAQIRETAKQLEEGLGELKGIMDALD